MPKKADHKEAARPHADAETPPIRYIEVPACCNVVMTRDEINTVLGGQAAAFIWDKIRELERSLPPRRDPTLPGTTSPAAGARTFVLNANQELIGAALRRLPVASSPKFIRFDAKDVMIALLCDYPPRPLFRDFWGKTLPASYTFSPFGGGPMQFQVDGDERLKGDVSLQLMAAVMDVAPADPKGDNLPFRITHNMHTHWVEDPAPPEACKLFAEGRGGN